MIITRFEPEFKAPLGACPYPSGVLVHGADAPRDAESWLGLLSAPRNVPETATDGAITVRVQDGTVLRCSYEVAAYDEWKRSRASIPSAEAALRNARTAYYKAVLAKAATLGLPDAQKDSEQYAKAEAALGWTDGKTAVADAEARIKVARSLPDSFMTDGADSLEGPSTILDEAATLAKSRGMIVNKANGIITIQAEEVRSADLIANL